MSTRLMPVNLLAGDLEHMKRVNKILYERDKFHFKLKIYREHFKKRYFKDSLTEFEKLNN